MAELALGAAVDYQDRLGEAAARFHIGLAYARLAEHGKAQRVLERTERMYHREPMGEYRYNEALTAYAVSSVLEQRGYARTAIIARYQKALDLFGKAYEHYASRFDLERLGLTTQMMSEIRNRITDALPVVYVDGELVEPLPSKQRVTAFARQ